MPDSIYFSIIIPLYNKERHIDRAIQSVLAQSVSTYEIIIVDDGSTDTGPDIVKRFTDSRIRYYRKENEGVSSARNQGIILSQYNNIAFLDADDAWKPQFLENVLKLMRKFPDAAAFVTAYDIIRKDNKRYIPNHSYIPADDTLVLIPNYFKSMIYGDPMITSSSICIKKHVFVDIGVFPLEEKLGEDKDMWARIALKYKIAFSWYIGATYFENADNRTCLKYIPNYERYFIKSMQKKLNDNEVPLVFVKDVKKYISKNLIMLAAKNIKTGNPVFAREILKDKRCNLYYSEKYFWTFFSFIHFKILRVLMNIFKIMRNFRFFRILLAYRIRYRYQKDT